MNKKYSSVIPTKMLDEELHEWEVLFWASVNEYPISFQEKKKMIITWKYDSCLIWFYYVIWGLKLLLTAIVFLHSESTVQRVKPSDLHREENDVSGAVKLKAWYQGQKSEMLKVITQDNPHWNLQHRLKNYNHTT